MYGCQVCWVMLQSAEILYAVITAHIPSYMVCMSDDNLGDCCRPASASYNRYWSTVEHRVLSFFSFCPHCWLCLGFHTQPGERSLLLSRLPGWGRVYVSWAAVHPQCMLCLPWGGAWYQVCVGEGERLWSGLKPGDRCPFSRILVFHGHSGSRVWGGRGYVPSSPAAASPCHSAMLSMYPTAALPCHSAMLSMYLWNSSTFGFSSPSLNFLFTPHTSICSFCALTFLMSCTR